MRSNLLKHNNLMLRSERRERLEAWAASDRSHIVSDRIIDAIISPQAGCSLLTMYLPEFRTMVVALMPHPGLQKEPFRAWNARRSSLDPNGPGRRSGNDRPIVKTTR